MRLLIFGASGQTGRELVKQALERGHDVSAFVRQPSRLTVQDKKLRVIAGDVGDAAAVRDALPGHDAVVSALGVGTPLKHDATVIDGVRHIVEAMQQRGPKRLVYQSFIGVPESRAAVGFILRFIAPIPLREEIADHVEKERIVRSSTLDWTIVRPPKLTNGPRTGRYRSGEDVRTWAPVPSLSRADVADFMLRELAAPAHIRGTPRVLA